MTSTCVAFDPLPDSGTVTAGPASLASVRVAAYGCASAGTNGTPTVSEAPGASVSDVRPGGNAGAPGPIAGTCSVAVPGVVPRPGASVALARRLGPAAV